MFGTPPSITCSCEQRATTWTMFCLPLDQARTAALRLPVSEWRLKPVGRFGPRFGVERRLSACRSVVSEDLIAVTDCAVLPAGNCTKDSIDGVTGGILIKFVQGAFHKRLQRRVVDRVLGARAHYLDAFLDDVSLVGLPHPVRRRGEESSIAR